MSLRCRKIPAWLIFPCVLLIVLFRTNGATFVVTNMNDSGAASLRQAIQDANAASGPDGIIFSISGSPPFTINILSALPILSEITLDATTQPGFAGKPVVELNGVSAGGGTVGLRLGVSNVVRGLAINRFTADGIRCENLGNTVQGCYVGTDTTGTIARGNTQYGIFVNGSANNRIGGTNAGDGNVISGGNDTGIYLLNATATGNVIQGNIIGLSSYGTNRLPNLNNGIAIFGAPGNTVGGTSVAARNILSGNNGSGINVNSGGTGTVIQGNYIGLATNGSSALSNLADGITINGVASVQIGGTNTGAGNVISGNGKVGVFLNGGATTGNRVEGNLIGTDATGLVAVGNNFAGITLSGASGNTIGGALIQARNVISGNKQDGIFATNSAVNLIRGNFIGVNVSGNAALGNTFTGVTLDNSASNQIVGSLSGVRSVVSGNANIGIWLNGSNSRSNIISGNYVGTDANGALAVSNTKDGVRLTSAPYNQIGSLLADERNILSGNGWAAGVGAGLLVDGAGTTGNKVLGNYIGTDLSGNAALANRTEGIYVHAAKSNSFGSELIGAGNLISGNTTTGILLTNASFNLFAGNFIGTRADGISPLGNGYFGIEMNEGCISNTAGGLPAGAGNRIAFNGVTLPRAGLRVRDGFGTNPTNAVGNAIFGNAIFSNVDLGIDIGQSGVSANDNCDSDSGGNNRQNFPDLTQAVSGAITGIRGTFNGAANTAFRLQFFSSPSCDVLGNGEGMNYLGDKIVTTGAFCTNTFVVTLPVSIPPGHVITATATDPANNTSEFSVCRIVTILPTLSMTLPSATQIALAWTNTAPGFVLKETTNLTPAVVWTTVTNAPVTTDGNFVVTLVRQSGNRFYILSFE